MRETDRDAWMGPPKSTEIEFVVRCKNCKHGRLITNPDFYEDHKAPRVFCYKAGKHLFPNHFCSWGEMKDEH